MISRSQIQDRAGVVEASNPSARNASGRKLRMADPPLRSSSRAFSAESIGGLLQTLPAGTFTARRNQATLDPTTESEVSHGQGRRRSRGTEALCPQPEALQQRTRPSDGRLAGAVRRPRRNLARPGARKVRPAVHRDHAGPRPLRGSVQPADPLSAAQGRTHRRVPQPAVGPPMSQSARVESLDALKEYK